MTEEKSWLEQTIEKIHADIPESAWMQGMYRALDFLMKEGAWDSIYAFMIMDDLPKIPERGIAVLRFTSPVQSQTSPGWALLFGRVHRELKRQGKDPEHALRGLDKEA